MPVKSHIPSKVEVGQLFRVHTSFFAQTNSPVSKRRKKLEMIPGDILEIRFPFAWNFRMAEGYAHCKEDVLLSHCDFFGAVDFEVRRSNKESLAQILKKKHYKTVNEMLFIKDDMQR